LVISLANTQEPLFIVNRSGNRPSHDGAPWFDEAIKVCQRAGFRQIYLRGDTDFSQTEFLDGWAEAQVRFVFGLDAMPNLVRLAEAEPASAWQTLQRPPRYTVATQPRQPPPHVKDEIVVRRQFRNLRLRAEHVTELAYRPGACQHTYRLIVVRKDLVVEQGGQVVEEQVRYLFYLTNEPEWSVPEIVYFANQRCNQENLLAQLKTGVRALRAPVNTLEANWAYMVIGALAWSFKAWLALLQPQAQQRHTLLSMEFKKFLQELLLLPCQILCSGRRLVYRFLTWNPWVQVLVRTLEIIRQLKFP
jgi:hypothetical protein